MGLWVGMTDVTDTLASLGRKLDTLDLTDAERTVLAALLPESEVEGFTSTSFGAKVPTFGSLIGDEVMVKGKSSLLGDDIGLPVKGVVVASGGNGI